MKKPVLVILLLLTLLPADADTLSYDSSDQSLVYRGKFFSFSTSSGAVGGHFGPLKAGQISSDRHIHALIDSYSYLWDEHIRDDTESVKGLALSFDKAGFFALYEPGLLTGFSLDIKGFEFALAISGEREADDELFLSHNERHGFESLLIRTCYSSCWLHSSLKLSLRDETGIDIFASAGLSFKGLTVAFATGNEADVLGREADVHRAWYLTLDTDRLDFRMSLKYLNDPAGADLGIGFGQWVAVMFPYMLVILLLSWLILLWFFPFKQKEIHLELKGSIKHDWRSVVVSITFVVTLLCWVLDKQIGINANVVAMIPVGVFCATGIITSKDLQEINWSVLWMVAGGFALGTGLQDTGLAQHLIEHIPFSHWSPILMVIGSGLICWTISNFISNTATAALLMPILAIVGSSMSGPLASVGGEGTLLMGIAVSASLAMMLPISTPPNALAHATGMVRQRDMEKVGLLVGIGGLALGYAMLVMLGKWGYF